MLRRAVILVAAVALIAAPAAAAELRPSDVPKAYSYTLSRYGNLALVPSGIPDGYRFVTSTLRSTRFLFSLRWAGNGAALTWTVSRTTGCSRSIYRFVDDEGTTYRACLGKARIEVRDGYDQAGQDAVVEMLQTMTLARP